MNLSPKQAALRDLLLSGRSGKEIAHVLGRPDLSVKVSVVALYKRLGVGGRIELMAAEIEWLRAQASGDG